ncbi:MAG: hypothetical protein OXC10_03950 [Rhodospirillaceae bacterium]|nr:hypothetical protein [Rhodospirillaceae bacterium]
MAQHELSLLFLDQDAVEAAAPPLAEMIEIVEDTFRLDGEGRVDVPVKIGVRPDYPRSFLHAMPAWVDGRRALGAKAVTYYPGNFDRGLHDSSAVILVYDADTGQPACFMEGLWITFVRTAACATVAAKYLAGPEPKRLGLVGCGGLGHWSLKTMAEAFPGLEEVHVASRTAESREAFCARMAGQGDWRLHPVARNRDAVAGMDIVVSSTPHQPEPRLLSDWLSPGTAAISFDYPYCWDDETYRSVDRFVTDSDAAIQRAARIARESGGRPDFALPSERIEFGSLVRAGRQAKPPGERVLVTVTGLASTDVALASEIYRRAQDRQLGERLRLR